MGNLAFDNTITTLGKATVPSPLKQVLFVNDDEHQLYETDLRTVQEVIQKGETPPSFERAGPRKKIYYDSQGTRVALVTCGGLCPGLNDVIRAIVMELYYNYRVTDIIGFRYGYNGIKEDALAEPVRLTPEYVTDIHNWGGTILGTSRGAPDYHKIVHYLEQNGVNILFTIGGDGTLNGAHLLAQLCLQRKNNIAVVGVPKTIDNDIMYTSRTFGFLTAVEEGRKCITSVHNEALSAPNCVGIAKLMGRDSGFIAANATLANNSVTYCLIPEDDFDLEGEKGLLDSLKERLKRRRHAVIVVAEGAGQKFFENEDKVRDRSGNILHKDIGIYLRDRIISYASEIKMPINVKYIDPSYTIRSLAANAEDSAFCIILGQNAVHAAMAGKTDMIVSSWNNTCVHVPIKLAINSRKKIDPDDVFWQIVINATGQPSLKN